MKISITGILCFLFCAFLFYMAVLGDIVFYGRYFYLTVFLFIVSGLSLVQGLESFRKKNLSIKE